MDIVDVKTQFGPLPMASSDLAVDDLLGLMQKHGVRAAFTLSTLGLLLDPMAGNMATKAACGDHPELLPVATLNPMMYFGDSAADGLSGYRLVRFAPAMQNYPLDFAPFAELASQVGASLPIMVDVAKPGDITQLERAIGDLPKPVILSNVSAELLSEAVAVMKRRKNWTLETSQLQIPGGVKLAAETLGAERVLFGTSAPLQPVAGAIQTIRLSGLPEPALTQIFGANAQKMLGQ